MEPHGQLDLLLLATLRRVGPRHGYALIAAVRQESGGAFELAEGTVYPALRRLELGGAITASAAGRRRAYRLTSAGQALLAGRRRQWQAWVEAVGRVVGPP